MASFEEHIAQAKSNIDFLSKVDAIPNHWDWKTTICFYICVHLVNAHTAKKADMHFRSHFDTELALNPEEQLSVCKLNESTFLAYKKLKNLSRRARYMCSDAEEDKSATRFLTHDKHFSKAVRHLNTVIAYIADNYGISFPVTQITCHDFKAGSELKFFRKK